MTDGKIAIISDIHANSWALEAVLEDIAKRDIKTIINLGDTLYGPLDPAGTFKLLSSVSVLSIAGNMDRYINELFFKPEEELSIKRSHPTMQFILDSLSTWALDWLKGLKAADQIGEHIFACHGNPVTDDMPLMEKIEPNGVFIKDATTLEGELKGIGQRIILCAHTHVPRLMYLENKIIINPGSVGLPSYTDDAPYPHKMQSYSPHAKYTVIATSGSELLSIDQISLKYDWARAAAAAKKNNRPDWEHSILHGIEV